MHKAVKDNQDCVNAIGKLGKSEQESAGRQVLLTAVGKRPEHERSPKEKIAKDLTAKADPMQRVIDSRPTLTGSTDELKPQELVRSIASTAVAQRIGKRIDKTMKRIYKVAANAEGEDNDSKNVAGDVLVSAKNFAQDAGLELQATNSVPKGWVEEDESGSDEEGSLTELDVLGHLGQEIS